MKERSLSDMIEANGLLKLHLLIMSHGSTDMLSDTHTISMAGDGQEDKGFQGLKLE